DRISNGMASITDTYVYKSFGESQVSTGSTLNVFKFLGQLGIYINSDLVNYFARARFYDTDIGRWISTDPLGFGGGDVNLFRYVRNNPTNYTDPSGEDCPGCDIPGWVIWLLFGAPSGIFMNS